MPGIDVSSFENLDVTRTDGVVSVTIASTSKMNAMNHTLIREIFELAVWLNDIDDARCVVITGTDGVFCAGGDITEFAGDEPTESVIRENASTLHTGIELFQQADVPIVVGVDGPAAGAGFSLAILGDIVIASEDAFFQFGYPGIGLTGDGGGTFFLPRLVGLREAKRLALLNERVSASEAAEIGLITEVVANDEFEGRLEEVTAHFATGPTLAYGRTKRLLTESYHRSLPEQLSAETEVMAVTTRSNDHKEGVEAFRAKREAEFTGT